MTSSPAEACDDAAPDLSSLSVATLLLPGLSACTYHLEKLSISSAHSGGDFEAQTDTTMPTTKIHWVDADWAATAPCRAVEGYWVAITW
jgi:hypothetical protein